MKHHIENLNEKIHIYLTENLEALKKEYKNLQDSTIINERKVESLKIDLGVQERALDTRLNNLVFIQDEIEVLEKTLKKYDITENYVNLEE